MKAREFWIEQISYDYDTWESVMTNDKEASLELDDPIHVIEASYAKELEAEVERLKKRLAPYQHNHFTRDIKEKGVCPSCDRYHEKQERKSLTEKLAVAVAALDGLQKYVAYNGDDWVRLEASEALASIRGNNG